MDLGLRTGLALYRRDGRLAWYRSQHFGTHDALRRGTRGLLDPSAGVEAVVVEGGGPLAEIWRRACAPRGITLRQIAAEDWRARLLPPRDRSKRGADALARRVIAWSGAPRPTSLRHDAAEAVLIGLWGVLELGWLGALPDELRTR